MEQSINQENKNEKANAVFFSITNKLILAPMVRVGTTPFRLLSIKYGADIVYTEEIIAKKLMNCIKEYNKDLNVNEYISIRDGSLVLRTHPDEKGKLVLQIGASDPEDAVKAALVVKDDIIGVDVNMGCPKHFSTHGNMGSSLLHQPLLAKAILENLVHKTGLPISCKIRLLETKEKTDNFIEIIQSTGIKFFAVHLRLKDQESKYKANWKALLDIKKVAKIPFVSNGDILSPYDIYYLKTHNICDGFMLARGAVHNPKIFEEYKNISIDEYLMNSDDLNVLDNDYEEVKDDEVVHKSSLKRTSNDDIQVSNKLSKIFEKKYFKKEIDIVPILREYVEIALLTGNNFHNSKYNVLYILKTHKKHLEFFKKIQNSRNYEEISTLLDMKDRFDHYSKSCENMARYYDNYYYRNKFQKKLDN